MSSTQSNVTIRRNLIYNLQETASENVIWVLGHDYDAGLSSQLWAIEGRNTLFEYNTIVGMTGLIGVQIGSGNIHHNVFFGLMPLGQYLSYMRKTSAYPDQPLVANSILQDFDSDYNCFITPVDNFQMASRYTGDAYNRAQALATFGWDPHSTFITEDNPADVFISPAAGNYRLKDSPPNPAPCQGMGYYADGVSDTNPPAAVSNLQVH